MLKSILILIAQELGKFIARKVLEKIWTDDTQRRISNFFKLQILVLYLKLILRKIPSAKEK